MPATELWQYAAKEPRRLVDANVQNQRLKQAEIINCKQNVIAFYQLITKNYATSVEFLKVKINIKIILLKLGVAVFDTKACPLARGK